MNVEQPENCEYRAARTLCFNPHSLNVELPEKLERLELPEPLERLKRLDREKRVEKLGQLERHELMEKLASG